MGSLSQAKVMGEVGSILVVLAFIPTVGFVVSIIGFVLMLIAVKYISDALNDSSLFTNVLIGIILAIVGVAIGSLVVIGAVLRFIGLSRLTPGTTPVPTNIFGLVLGVLAGLAVMWIMFTVGAYFQRKSYNTIATRLDVGMFRTAALLYLIGAALTIILIGFILLFVAQILFIIAFFSIRENMVSTATTSMTPPGPSPSVSPEAPVQSGGKFCVKCGASLPAGSAFCASCGASQVA
jgi:uncharacterized membrane protein